MHGLAMRGECIVAKPTRCTAKLDRSDEPVAELGHRFDVARIRFGVVERFADQPDVLGEICLVAGAFSVPMESERRLYLRSLISSWAVQREAR